MIGKVGVEMYQAKINVTLKKSVSDPQGQTVLHALHMLGFKEARHLRVGKFFELTIEAPDAQTAQQNVSAMCERLLSNPVIEDYHFEIAELGRS